MYNYLGVVYIVEPATSEMKALIEVDKFLREEILIPAVSKHRHRRKSQAITPFHFFDNFNFHHKITFITS